MIKSGLKRLLSKGETPEPKPYPFRYEGGSSTPSAEARPEPAPVAPEPAPQAAPEPASEPVVQAAPEAAPAPEPVVQAAPEPVVQATPEAAPAPEPAVQAEPVAQAEPEPEGPMPVEVGPEEFQFWTVTDLRRALTTRGVQLKARVRKGDLVKLLAETLEAEGAGAAEAGSSEEAPSEEGSSGGAEENPVPGLTEAAVLELLDDMVRPALQSDGGDIALIKVDSPDVHVKLVGACSTCPSSIMTMKMGIERLFREEFPGFGELIQVE